MNDDRESERFRHHYDEGLVEALLGLREPKGPFSRRRPHLTVVDLLSLARDPGGPPRHSDEGASWMELRGPLQPDGELAVILWDILMAIAMLPEKEQAVIALTAFGFTQRQIGRVLHTSKDEIRRIISGDPEHERESIVVKVTRSMNGGRAPA